MMRNELTTRRTDTGISALPSRGGRDSRNMRGLIAFLALAILLPLDGANAQGSPTPSPAMERRRLFIDPSSTSVKLGKASLVVTPLAPRANTYMGDYRLKVVPYFFKSEKGRLLLEAPQESYRRLAEGMAVEFTGVATNQKNGKTKIVTGKITPANNDRGQVIFSVATENGQMVFNTFYHFAP
jgi:hypothetical protein